MAEDFLSIGFYELRDRGMSVEEILKLIGTDREVDDVDRGILEAYEFFTPFEIARKEEERSKRELTLECIATLKKDLENYDRTRGLIFMEIQKRNLANLSIVELFNLETKIAKTKDKTINAFLKFKNILLEEVDVR